MSTPRRKAQIRLFYDGDCGLCHHSVRFVLARDEHRRFRYAPLGGPTFEPYRDEAVRANGSRGLPDSIVLVTTDGQVLLRSSAAAHILRELGGFWHLLGSAIFLVPRPLRDLAYDFVARVRHALFRRPNDVCPIPPSGQRDLFDP